MDLAKSLQLMTERLRADEEALRGKIAEIERATADLKSAQEQLVRSERLASVGRLAAGLAHEIGNPIAAILGFQELLLEGGLDEHEARDFLERMRRETERIHHVLRSMLDFARPQSLAPSAPAPQPAGLVSEAIADVVTLMAPQKSWKGVELVQDVAADLPPVALAHPQIVQVLLNLLLNAADAVPTTGGRVTVRATEGVSGPRRGVRIEVEDNGPGISAAIQGKLFEPFATTKEVGKGTGLGLAVCRGLVEAVGGTITAERGAEGGARFVLELPAARVL
jgi:signal transduction histidine kinase